MTTTDVTIGVDLGTTSVKALALDSAGRVVARSGGGYPLHSGTDGSAVQDAEQVVAVALDALSALHRQLAGVTVRAIVPSAAMHSLVLLDRSGRVMGPALTWADTRPALTLPQLRAQLDPAWSYPRTGCPLQAPYHPARLWWLRQTQPDVFGTVGHFVSLTDLLLHRLTGHWATSVGLASTTGLWNLQASRWDPELLAALGIQPGRLPTVLDAREPVGPVLAGPWRGVPVLAGSSDGALANLGTGAALEDVVVTVGTSGAVRRLSARPHLDPLARSWSYRLDLQTHLVGGAINNGGLLLDWVRRSWYSDLDTATGFARLLHDAGEVPAGADGLTLLPYLSGERSPHWRADLRATLHGLTLAHGRAQVARAALEAVAFSLAQVRALDEETPGSRVYSTGGLAADPGWNRLLASVLGVPVHLLEAGDASATGAALLGHERATLQALQREARTRPAVLPDPASSAALEAARTRWLQLYATLYPAVP